MLIGHYITRLSEKGRTALPAKYKKELGDIAIIAKWYEGCLVIVGTENWNGLLKKLTGTSEIFTEPVRGTERFILGSAFEIELDAQGRFVIPKSLRDYGNLGEEVTFVGLGNRIEIWNKKTWEEQEKYIQDNARDMIEKLAGNTT